MVIGIRNPLEHMKGKAIQALRSEGIHVDVLGEDLHGDMVEVCFSFIIFHLKKVECVIIFNFKKYFKK